MEDEKPGNEIDMSKQAEKIIQLDSSDESENSNKENSSTSEGNNLKRKIDAVNQDEQPTRWQDYEKQSHCDLLIRSIKNHNY